MNSEECAAIVDLWYSKPVKVKRSQLHLLFDVAMFRESFAQQHTLLLRQLASNATTIEVYEDPIGVVLIALASGVPQSLTHYGTAPILSEQIDKATKEVGIPCHFGREPIHAGACSLAVVCRWDQDLIRKVIESQAETVVILQAKDKPNEVTIDLARLNWLAMTFPEMRCRLNSGMDQGLILLERVGETAIEPSTPEKAARFTKAVTKHALDFWRATPPAVLKNRLATCRGCEFMNREGGSCRKCGCFIETKATWSSEECPIGLWDRPRVSCITATYDRVNLLEEAVESFLKQTYANSELIVINDCPEQDLVFDHPRVRIFNVKTRFTSLGEKLDFAVSQSTGELVCSWDDDDINLPWRIEAGVHEIQDFDYFNPLAYWVLLNGKFTYEMATGYAHNASMYRKTAWEAVGGYGTACGNQDAVLDGKLRKACRFREGPTRPRDTAYVYRWGVANHLSGNPNPQDAWNAPRPKAKRQGRVELVPRWRSDYLAKYTEKLQPIRGRVRVGVFMPCFATGGVERWLEGISKYTSDNVEWVGLCVDDTGPTDQQTVNAIAGKMPILTGPNAADEGRNALQSVRRMQRYEHAAHLVADLSDVLIVWGVSSIPPDARGAKVVVSHGGCDWTRSMLSKLVPLATHRVAVSTAAVQGYPEEFREGVRVILNGADPSRVVPDTPRNEYRQRNGIPTDAKVVGYIGRFSPEKNPYTVAQMIRATRGNGENVYGLLAGIGWGQAEFIDKFNQLSGDPSRVRFDFTPENIGNVYAAIDVLIIGSEVEGFSLACVEAWLAGVPVIMQHTGIAAEPGYADLVTPIPPKANDRQLMRAFKEALENTDRVRRAKQTAADSLTSQRMAERWESFLLEVKKD